MKVKLHLVFFLFLSFYTLHTQAQTIRYVKQDGTGNGSSWANASNDLQAMINSSASGDEIWVKEGIYVPSSYFAMKEGVKLYGGFSGDEISLAGRDYTAHVTILQKDGGRVFYNLNLSNATIIDGFTVTGDAAGADGVMYNSNAHLIIRNCIFSGCTTYFGAAIFNDASSPTISNCDFIGNTALYEGGAIENWNSSPTISDCDFLNNSSGSTGGAIHNHNSSPSINNCTFTNNSATYNGGAIYNNGGAPQISNCTFSLNTSRSGGGVMNNHSSVTITDCTFSGNTATSTTGDGGGIYNNASSSVVRNCIFENNTAERNGGAIITSLASAFFKIENCIFAENRILTPSSFNGGAAIYSHNSVPTVNNSLFYSNTSQVGSAIYAFSGIDIRNSTFYANTSSEGVIIRGGAAPVNLKNTIIWGNSGSNIYYGNNSVSYSNIEGGYGGTGNINSDPLFVNALNPKGEDEIWGTEDDGLILQFESPSANSGNNTLILEGTTTDITGSTRIQGNVVDMGAYETPYIPTILYVDNDIDESGLGNTWGTAFKTLMKL